MSTNIKCPECAHVFAVEDALSKDVEQKYQQQYQKEAKQLLLKVEEDKKRLADEQRLFEEKRKKENELFTQKLTQEKVKMEAEMGHHLRKSIGADYENEMRLLKQNMEQNEERLKAARQKEYLFLKREQELKIKEEELEIELQKKLMEERNVLTSQIRKEESEKTSIKETEHEIKLKEKDIQLDSLKKTIEELKRKSEEGSTRLQGEAQELWLEELLKDNFPHDSIDEVGKGIDGADCVQTVRNGFRNECGKIIFESKRTKTFQKVWIDKLKTDMRSKQADVAILVTSVYPKNFNCFGEIEGIWICSYNEVIALTSALRYTIIRIAETKKAEENKGEKMQMMYDYLTGTEFRQQIQTIVEGFLNLKNSINKERIQMEKIWKEREKQLDRVLISTSGLYGSIKGIAGASIGDIPLLEDGMAEEEEEAPPRIMFK